MSDGGVVFYTEFWDLFKKKKINIPPPIQLPNSQEYFPYVFVANEAFALAVNLMKPYPQKNCTNEQQLFNFRLSTARYVVENSFGILAAEFGVFKKAINVEPEKATTITLACCYLHNFFETFTNCLCATYTRKSTIKFWSKFTSKPRKNRN